MDDLTFRKTVYAEPFTKDPAVIEAAANDIKKQAFWDEIKLMESQLQTAMNIPVPENLAEKLILRQSLKEHKQTSQKRPWYIALAASVAIASVLTIGVLKTGDSKLTSDVYAHLGHVNDELAKGIKVDTDAINDKLASFNGHVDGDLGEVVSANYCYLDKIKSLHLIIRGENGLTSLFVVPDSISETIGETFSNATYKGASFLIESAKVIVVGENESEVDIIEKRAKKSLSFSA